MYRLWLICVVSSLFIIMCFYFVYIDNNTGRLYKEDELQYNSREDFENFDNITGTKSGCYIIPNIIHFIRFNQRKFSFIDTVCILAAYKNQNPDYIYIHTNVETFYGKYWEYILSIKHLKQKLVIKFCDLPKTIFGQRLSDKFLVYHGGDITRLNILMEYGGIYLDNDSYIVRNLNDFRKYEITIGWREDGNISNQVIIANRNARFLYLWLETYRNQYKSKSWFYNAGIRPTQEVLMKNPSLVHREVSLLAPYLIMQKLYLQNWPGWRNLYAIHLYINHLYVFKKKLTTVATYPVIFDENNIKHYPVTIRDLVNDVYPLDLK